MYLKKWKAIDFKMANIGVFIKKYSKFQTTFKVTSYDDNNKEHICLDELNQNINFDEIIADIYPNSKEYRPKSFDSIYIYENIIYCIEFKNEKKPDKEDLEDKLLSGKKELDKLLAELNIQKNDFKFIFCLVYNIHKPRDNRYKRGIVKYDIKTYLKKYKENNFVDDIFTEDVNFFSNQFKKKLNKELKCE
ncbi:MAG: hypothetical protein ACI81I_000359 [Arcobacteraceae bacterium]|jgi:hypothetical protein